MKFSLIPVQSIHLHGQIVSVIQYLLKLVSVANFKKFCLFTYNFLTNRGPLSWIRVGLAARGITDALYYPLSIPKGQQKIQERDLSIGKEN